MNGLDYVGRSLRGSRALGRPFDSAWALACRTLPPARSLGQRTERAQVLVALEATRESWRRAYEREPPAAVDVAAATLVEHLREGDALVA